MKHVDFLFIYEVKAREIENICLIKYELEKRGYSVGIINTWFYLKNVKPEYTAEVIITFALYNNDTFNFIATYVNKFNKIVNMQWEQIGSNKEETDKKSLFFLSGVAKKAYHICWGEQTKDRLKNVSQIDEKKLLLTGHISLDFLRPEFREYYLTKEELFSTYNIPSNKKVCLFVSSFSYVNLPENIASLSANSNDYTQKFIEVSSRSQNKILNWFSLVLDENTDVIFIYRPHPAEANNEIIQGLENKYDNFYVISDLSVKQWILVSDIIYNWYSTSLMEIYKSKKQFYILRPEVIPHEMDLSIYNKAVFIESVKEFKNTLTNNNYNQPIDKELLLHYYYIDDEPSFKKITNNLVDIYKQKTFEVIDPQHLKEISLVRKFVTYVKSSFYYKFGSKIKNYIKVWISKEPNNNLKESIKYNNYVSEMIQRNYATDFEINEITSKIAKVIESIDTQVKRSDNDE